MVTMRIHTDTFVAGEPVSAGETIQVSEEVAWRLAGRGVLVMDPVTEAEANFEAIRDGDPVAESREPKRSHHSKK